MPRSSLFPALPDRRLFWLALAVLFVATAALYAPVVGFQLLRYDDDTYVMQNPLIHPLSLETVAGMFTRTYFRSYTPLTHLSHAVDFAIWGRDPFGHHATNYLLHIANTVLVFLFACLLLVRWRRPTIGEHESAWKAAAAAVTPPILTGALATALLFTLHPLRAESVAWVSDRKDLLMTFFALLASGSFLLYASARTGVEGRRWYRATLILSVLAMLSKSIASLLPVLFLLFDAFTSHPGERKGRWISLVREQVPLLVAGLAIGLLSVLAVTGIVRHPQLHTETPLEIALLPGYAWLFYVVKTLWPSGLSPIYTYPSLTALFLSMVLILVITAFAVRAHVRGTSAWILAWTAYILFLLPTILGKDQAGIQPWADRYSYLPSIALAGLAGAGIRWAWEHGIGKWKRIVVGGAVVVCCILGFLTARQLPVWKNTVALFTHAVEANPDALMAHAQLGVALSAEGRHDAAIVSLERVLALNSHYAVAYAAMALAYHEKGEPSKAIDLFRKAIALDSNLTEAYSNLGNTLLSLDRIDEAIQQYSLAIHVDPDFSDAYHNLGIAYYRKGDTLRSLETFRRSASVNPINADTYVSMGIIYQERGEQDSALAAFREAAALGHLQAKHLLESRTPAK